jgi:hypothetical protein
MERLFSKGFAGTNWNGTSGSALPSGIQYWSSRSSRIREEFATPICERPRVPRGAASLFLGYAADGWRVCAAGKGVVLSEKLR